MNQQIQREPDFTLEDINCLCNLIITQVESVTNKPFEEVLEDDPTLTHISVSVDDSNEVYTYYTVGQMMKLINKICFNIEYTHTK